MKIYFVTNNANKWESAQHALNGLPIDLQQAKLETPEIQSTDGKEIAEFSAKWACEKLQAPVIKTDATWSFEGLNGFPGPFAKYTQEWLTLNDYMKLLEGKNRAMSITEYLCFQEPNKPPVTFSSTTKGIAAATPSPNGRLPFDHLFIPEGKTTPIGEWTSEEDKQYWANHQPFWKELAKYLEKINRN